jgi:predicted secreted Zn-dependent protease
MSFSFLPLWISVLFLASFPETTPTPVYSANIPWTVQKRLSWDDFAGNPAPNNQHHALTSTNMEMKVKCENNQLKFKVDAVFNPKESWTRNKSSALLLAHEQLHFDLTELHARMLRKRLALLPNACTRGASDLNKYASEAFDNWHKEQDLYDSESRHGLDRGVQMDWIASVEERLKELEAYK